MDHISVSTGAQKMWRRFVFTMEGPGHGRLRRLLNPAFITAAVNRLRPRMREIVHGLVDRFAADGVCEFVSAFADHYPPHVMAQLARVEMHEALPILAQRLPGLALAGEPVHRPRLAGFVGPESLPIRVTPAATHA